MPKLNVTSVANAPPKPTKAGEKWAGLEAMLDKLRPGECVLLEPEPGDKPRSFSHGLGPIAKRRSLDIRKDPDGVRIWLVPKLSNAGLDVDTAEPGRGETAGPLGNGLTPAPSATAG